MICQSKIIKNTDQLLTRIIDRRSVSWLLIAALILLTAWLRARISGSSPLLPGINGGYYPLLVRNLIETGSLRYPDTPLVYWIQAPLSLFIRLFQGQDTDSAVIMASRLFDAIVPALTCIPVYLFSRKVLNDKPDSLWMALAAAAFSCLYLSVLLVMNTDLQKNGAGMLLAACYLNSAFNLSIRVTVKRILVSLLFLVLTALTHTGCFALIFVFTLVAGTGYLIRQPRQNKRNMILSLLSALGVLLLVSVAVLWHDPDRLARVISLYLNPLRIVEAPYLWVLLSGQFVYFGFLFYNLMIINALSISGFILVFIFRKRLSPVEFPFVMAMALVGLILSSPLIGMEWALRFHLMAFLPIAFSCVFVCKVLKNRFAGYLIIAMLAGLSLLSGVAGYRARPEPAITTESYTDLKELGLAFPVKTTDLIVARHGLEWWVGWTMHCRTGKEYCLRAADWDKYPSIFLLKQLSGNNYPGQQGTGQFAEFPIPPGSEMVASNRSFVLYRLGRPDKDLTYPGELPLLQGVVKEVHGNRVTIRSGGYRQPVEIKPTTLFIGESLPGIRPGMRADIWGHRIPFSLVVKAERIRAYEQEYR